jgi:hypothetical protein
MKPYMARCPGQSQDPSTRRSCRREMDPAFAGEAFNILGRHEQGCFLLSYFCFQVKTDETA